MAYRAKKRFPDYESAQEVLGDLGIEPLPTGGDYNNPNSHVVATVNYAEGTVTVSRRFLGDTTNREKRDFKRPSWPEFAEFLEANGGWK